MTSPRVPFVGARRAPWTVRVSFWVMVALVVVGVVVQIVGVPSVAATMPSVAAGVTWFVFMAGVIAVNILLAFAILGGRNWARILVTIFAILGVLTLLFQLATGDFQTALSYVDSVLYTAAVALLWLPVSNIFYRDVKSDRGAQKAQGLQPQGWKPIR